MSALRNTDYSGKVKKKNSDSHDINTLVMLFNEERYTEAAALAQVMTVKFPLHGVGWKALGVAFQQMGRNEEALGYMQKAAELSPIDAEVHCNLGCILFDLGRLDEAEACYLRALDINPNFVEAHNNLGNTLQHLGRFDEAESRFRRVLQISPDYAKAHSNLGNTFYELERFDEAEACYRRALQINPNFVEAHSNLANVLIGFGRVSEAEVGYRRALEINPDFTEARNMLIFVQNLLLKDKPVVRLTEAIRYGEIVARQAHPYKLWSNAPDPSKCLRIGLVSGDFSKHPVGFFLEEVLRSLTTQFAGQIEIFAYTCHLKNDEVTARIKAYCHGWNLAVGVSDECLAKRIRDDGIDILIDLSGHTTRNRLPMFAWKPAPIQVSWLGYFATTGVAAIDYLIADPYVLPETEEVYFTEKIWRLPETRLCFTQPDVTVDVSPLPALTNGYITFGCFNNLAKMNDDVVALWARVLISIPYSRLILKAKQLKEVSVRQKTIERFAAHGINADRLMLEVFETRERYFEAYHRVDIALDPFPYPGGTTSVEGLWMGVPVLTLEGESFLSRQGVGILMNVGLPGWISTSEEDYVARAGYHAADLRGLAALRKELRQQVLASPIFNASSFAKNFETALRGMWQRWCNGGK